MPLFLKQRNEEIVEKMDQPDCDKALLFNTYQQFETINRLISGWQSIYKKLIKPIFSDTSKKYSILDIGCGGGDIIHLLNRLAKKDGVNVQCIGIEPDKRALEFLSTVQSDSDISFKNATSTELAEQNERFDLVVSNHLLHHLAPSEIQSLCKDAENIAKRKVIFSDIERSDIGYVLFKVAGTPLFRNSFIVEDGLTSIKRSFRKEELQEILPNTWTVKRQFPFRLLAIYNAS